MHEVFHNLAEVSPKIETKEHAYEFLNDERRKLQIESPIQLQISSTPYIGNSFYGVCGVNDYGSIIVVSQKGLNRIALKHEIYHVKQGRHGKLGNTLEESIAAIEKQDRSIPFLIKLRAFYAFEWQADLYALTGLKM